MGTLVFQATLGGSVNLIGPNTASNVNFTLPSADGSSGQALTTNGSGTLAFGTLAVTAGGTGVTTSTGSGSNVLSTSPTLVTPILGTPTSVTLTNATGLPLTTGVTGTLPVANGGTGLTSTPANGALDIGNGTGFTRTTLTAGSNVTITNGAGSITIAATGGGSSQWTTTGSDIYYNTGNVGIGTTTFTSISGTVKTLSLGGTNASTSGGIAYQVNGTVKGYHYVDADELTHQSVSGGHKFLAVNAEKARINTYGLGLGGAVPSSGIGITFPATQSASSDANTLDDYEEGTWTPAISTGIGSITSYTSSGKYTKIGRQVTLFATFTITNAGTATANLFIDSLPFAQAVSGEIVGNGYFSGTGVTPTTVLSGGGTSTTNSIVRKYDGTFRCSTSDVFTLSIVYNAST